MSYKSRITELYDSLITNISCSISSPFGADPGENGPPAILLLCYSGVHSPLPGLRHVLSLRNSELQLRGLT
jgi:hypothetical protein